MQHSAAEIRVPGPASVAAVRKGTRTFQKVFGHAPEVRFFGTWHVPGVPAWMPEGHVRNTEGLLLRGLAGRCALVQGDGGLYHIRLDSKMDGQAVVYRTPTSR